MSASSNPASAQSSQEVLLFAHDALMAALHAVKESIKAAAPLEVPALASDKAARDERWKLTMHIGGIVVSKIYYIA
jgi:hypothetical protein